MRDPASVLVLAPNWLGDVVMALPAIADVRRQFPGGRLTVAARRSVAEVFRLVSFVDHVVALEGSGGWWHRSQVRGDVARLHAWVDANRDDLLERRPRELPIMLQYRTHAANQSRYNTPPVFGIYILRLVLKWMRAQGVQYILAQPVARHSAPKKRAA